MNTLEESVDQRKNDQQNQNKEVTKNGLCKQYIHGQCQRAQCPYSHDDSKIKRCTKFQQNSHCKFGDQCDFSHKADPNKSQQQQICGHFLQGQCRFGDSCQNKHVYLRCVSFDQGFCPQGPDCQFVHVTLKLCKDYVYGYCPKGNKCDKAHPKAFSPIDLEFYQQQYQREQLIQCHLCQEIGHKKTQCFFSREIDPNKTILCGLCEQNHKLSYYCAQRRVPIFNNQANQ
ncbi:zinc finger C-x8-C-x5-C-x3-H type protein (macronuclear) [Tetrahymena thermophila SB210]|uniref:Zinc finger C-x8-C-x5-C-x3-H type protein n=1 Tax=Tetrahymena thermophila (strain SB210) TaxID=312017 RepID=Q232V8_TETTS|nr:zinc finger C-x8-C-x5-C-x3-H type protein [Tetrahymena thermophila SB210]EAR91722.1 zinc finger C-x8-C-x5-C-x3-H type protein [Tetrahymena thermophila SB210]|eukprot:XP_001011967.1 zinc finger C-x8-C-x5-C-x3-H type protein [Tetrahymena thermophila SB210]